MSILGTALVLALCIPIVALIVDSPIGRAIGRRLEREPTPGTRRDERIADLERRLELLEGDLEILQHQQQQVRDEQQFLQRLLEDSPRTPRLPSDDT